MVVYARGARRASLSLRIAIKTNPGRWSAPAIAAVMTLDRDRSVGDWCAALDDFDAALRTVGTPATVVPLKRRRK